MAMIKKDSGVVSKTRRDTDVAKKQRKFAPSYSLAVSQEDVVKVELKLRRSLAGWNTESCRQA